MINRTPCHSLKLPFMFDETLLVRDLSLCVETTWNKHFNTNDYTGDWTSISLYSATGNPQDIRTFSSETFRPTPLLGLCDYFRSVIDAFQCEKEAVRLLQLAPGSVIHTHRDRGLAYEHRVFRLHVPLQTNPDVEFIVDEKRMDMRAGECWYANFDLPHRVNNPGPAARVHLVIDCKRNDWSDDLFGKAGYDFEAEKCALEPDAETKRRIQEELLRMNTEMSRKMAQQLDENNRS